MTAGSSRPKNRDRSTAEWVTFGVSCAIVLGFALVVATQLFTSDAPARPVAHPPGPAQRSDGTFHVPVAVENTGDHTAAEVQVTADLTIGGATETGDQTIDFLGGGEREVVTFVFARDPNRGDLAVRVSSYREP